MRPRGRQLGASEGKTRRGRRRDRASGPGPSASQRPAAGEPWLQQAWCPASAQPVHVRPRSPQRRTFRTIATPLPPYHRDSAEDAGWRRPPTSSMFTAGLRGPHRCGMGCCAPASRGHSRGARPDAERPSPPRRQLSQMLSPTTQAVSMSTSSVCAVCRNRSGSTRMPSVERERRLLARHRTYSIPGSNDLNQMLREVCDTNQSV